jgi:hypothetical protein
MMTLFIKRTVVTKPKEVEPGSNLAGFSKEGCGSKRVVLSMMMMMMTWSNIPECTIILHSHTLRTSNATVLNYNKY